MNFSSAVNFFKEVRAAIALPITAPVAIIEARKKSDC